MTSRLAVTAILLIALAAGTAHAAEPEFRAIQIHHWIDGGLSPEQIDQTIRGSDVVLRDVKPNVKIVVP